MTAINWTTEGLATYLGTLGLTNGTNITTLVNRLTTVQADLTTDFKLVEMMNGAIPYIIDVAKSTWSDTSGAQTTAATIATWVAANRPDMPYTLASIIDDIVATDINTNLMPTDIVTPSTITIDSKNVYITGVASLLTNITKYLRHYCEATTENWSASTTSSTYGVYIAPLPETIF